MNHERPVRIQRKRTKGFNLQDASPNGLPVVFVGRPTNWGNPFKIGDWCRRTSKDGRIYLASLHISDKPMAGYVFIENADMAVYLYSKLQMNKQMIIEELRGKDLACWCGLYDEKGLRIPCHADVLLEIANK